MAETKSANLLREALNVTLTADAGLLVTVLGSLTNERVVPLVREYNQTFSRDLHTDIKSKTASDFEKACIALTTEVDEFDARNLRTAFQGLGTDDSGVAEILCTRTDAELKSIAHAYNRMYQEELKARVHSEFSSNLRTLHETLLRGGRSSSGDIDTLVAQLHKAAKGFGCDRKTFIAILGGHTREVCMQIAEGFLKAHGKTLAKLIKSEFSGNMEDALLVLVTPSAQFHGDKLVKYFTATNTNEAGVLRIIRSRKEKDLVQISQYLQNTHKKKKPLAQWVTEKLGNKFKRTMVAVTANFAGSQSM